jgi:hypothetical protein
LLRSSNDDDLRNEAIKDRSNRNETYGTTRTTTIDYKEGISKARQEEQQSNGTAIEPTNAERLLISRSERRSSEKSEAGFASLSSLAVLLIPTDSTSTSGPNEAR